MSKASKSLNFAEVWEELNATLAFYVNSEFTGVKSQFNNRKKVRDRGIVQRLKGKTGRFRGNLSGKRVNFTARTVISPDPNLRIDQVGVPEHVAKILTFPERVTAHNIKFLKRCVSNGTSIWPGANYIKWSSDDSSTFLKSKTICQNAAKKLRIGDLVERHVWNGDTVLFNRQPSLHRLSMMSHKVKVLPFRTLRFNPCVCGPYNADFDGDEMNLHLPQTQEARAEADVLMASKHNVNTPRSGEPVIAALQDFISGSFLLTHKDNYFTKHQIVQMASNFLADLNLGRIDLPPPALIKPVTMWTGKQVYSMIMEPSKKSSKNPVLVNLACPGKTYSKKGKDLCPNDGYVVIRNSELLAGRIDKSTIGSGSKNNIFYLMLRDYGTEKCKEAIWRMTRLIPDYLKNRGFSIGIGDVTPSDSLELEKQDLVDNGYAKTKEYIESFKSGKLQAAPGCTVKETLEAKILKELSAIRETSAKSCYTQLHSTNTPLNMAKSGAKGSNINISQMIACVGQQAISGSRIPDGFEDRSLPHFPKKSLSPEARGFVSNSFYSGLTPTEFWFHTMGGREGLVDTAVKTAETGYMQRRLMKALEDLCAEYDGTVRSSQDEIVQFEYGGDSLEPTMMEAVFKSGPSNGEGKVCDFDRLLERAMGMQKPDSETSLSSEQIQYFSDTVEEDPRISEIVLGKSKRGNSVGTRPVKYHAPTWRTCSATNEKTQTNCVKEYVHPDGTLLGRSIVDRLKEFITSLAKRRKALEDKYRDKSVADTLFSVSTWTLKQLVSLILHKYHLAMVEPGTAVGALCATSIGEPATQMTLKTFHFAGVASMNITLGVPRMKEIINASKNIKTPIIDARLEKSQEWDLDAVRLVKARIEKTTLGQILEFVEEVYKQDDFFLLLKIDIPLVKKLKLQIDSEIARWCILNHIRPKLKVDQVYREISKISKY